MTKKAFSDAIDLKRVCKEYEPCLDRPGNELISSMISVVEPRENLSPPGMHPLFFNMGK